MEVGRRICGLRDEFLLIRDLNMFYFLPYLLGEDSDFDYFFSNGLKPPTSYVCNDQFTLVAFGNIEGMKSYLLISGLFCKPI